MIGKSGQIDLLSLMLDAANLRHAVIAQNLANVNTPNYRRLEVAFEGELDRHLVGHGPGHAGAKVIETADAPARADGNTVDMDVEMSLLQRNSLLMTAASQVLALKLAQLRSAITGR